MRQRKKKIGLITLLLLMVVGVGSLWADITGTTLTVTTDPPAQSGIKFNGGVAVSLKAAWTAGDTPPFAATFNVGGGGPSIGTVDTAGHDATLLVTGSTLGQGDGKAFGVSVIETSQVNPTPGTANGDKSIDIDMIPPTITVVVDSPTGIFSNIAPNNVVRFTVNSTNKPLAGEPAITISPNPGSGWVPDGTPTTKDFRYTLTLSTAAPGNYTIRAVGKDNTLPTTAANSGAGQTNFTVKTDGPSAGTISASTPTSNSKNQTVSFAGKVSPAMATLAIFETTSGTPAKVGDATINGENWSASVPNLAEGKHKFVVKGTDNLGNPSASSNEFEVGIDLTPPQVASLTQPSTPTNKTAINISGGGALDLDTNGVKSLPVKVGLFKSGSPTRAPILTVSANADGTFTFNDVPLTVGESNTFYVQTEDAANGPPGNLSAYSTNVSVRQDGNPAGPATLLLARGASFASASLPITPPPYLGVGDYNLQVTFDKEMDQSVKLSVGVKPASGAEIVSTNGSWVGSQTYLGTVSIPAGQSSVWDGSANLRIFGAKDTAGNTMTEQSIPNAFSADTTPPVTTMDTMDTIYIGSDTPPVTLRGNSQDALSGIGFVEIATQSFTGGPIVTNRVPIFNGQSADWTYNWNTTNLGAGKYKLWVYAADQAKPDFNLEPRKDYRIVIVSRTSPSVDRISFDDESGDMNTPANPVPTVSSDVVKLSAIVRDNGGTGINFNVPPFAFTLVHDSTNTNIAGNYTNNGSDTIYFTFPKINLNGTYTVSVTPADKAGNVAPASASRTFLFDTTPPTDIVFLPPTGATVENTYPPIAVDQVWALNRSEPNFGTTSSTIEVTYNGLVVGNQIPQASVTTLIWDLYGANTHPSDQSGDGRYDITVVPTDQFGNTGPATRSYFFLDTQAPVITSRIPTDTWIGLANTNMRVDFSDAPNDIASIAGAAKAQDATWQGGQGSGINMATSSFFADMDAVTATGTPVAGANAFQLTRPNPPATADGVATITLRVRAADGVTLNQPNISSFTFSHLFDYFRPEFTFDLPLANHKYRQQTVVVKGSVRDQGTFADLAVVEAKARPETDPWVILSCVPSLPTKIASHSGVLDISTHTDGPLNIFGTCKDRGGNESSPNPQAAAGQFTQVTITIDRTPPAAPKLVLPLNDSISGTRGIRFKWSSVTDGDRYLFQISDDSSFNNVLNHVSNSYGLVGQITQMTEAAYSVPKDGTFFWRVAAIELCEDGQNVSSFSTTWRVNVDTVKPKVLEVQPTPSTGNKITTGMVTFTIRFSENMDTTVTPVVSLTSAGGQLMLIEQLSYKDNTWTGTTVIPKNSSAMYDGNATIAISNAKDLAGNQMESDSTHGVVINTGPAFEVKLFSNPAHEYELVIVTRSTEALQAPPTCSVTQSAARIPVPMNFLKERYYSGSYRINPDQPGKAYIDVTGTDLHGMIGRASVEFTVTALIPDAKVVLQSSDGKATLNVAANSVERKSALYILPRQESDNVSGAVQSAGILGNRVVAPVRVSQKDLVEILPLEELGPTSVRLMRRVWYSAQVGNLALKVPADKVNIYRQAGNTWVFCGGTLRNGRITAQLGGLGKLSLMADVSAPQMLRLTPGNLDRLEDPLPTFEGSFSDFGSGLASTGIALMIDGIPQPDVIMTDNGNLSYQVKKPLSKGAHRVSIEVSDKAGNTLRNDFTVTAPGPFGLDELQAYPNPAVGNMVFFTYNLQQRADDIALKIYDSAGHKVTGFDTGDFTALASGKIRWDLTNGDGDRVANGIYFYKFEAKRNGRTLKTRGKLAVMR